MACPLSRTTARILLTLLLVSKVAYAQRLVVDTYGVTDGLANGAVLSVAQDPDGVMWFATRAGLCSYDGYQWTQERADPVTGVTHSRHRVKVDDQGRVWSYSNTRPFRLTQHFGEEPVDLPTWEPDRTARCVGFEFIDGEPIVAVEDGRILRFEGNQWTPLYTPSEPAIHYSMVRDGDRLLIGASTGLVSFELDAPSHPVRVESLPEGPVFLLDIVEGEVVCVGETWAGALTADGFELKLESVDTPFAPDGGGVASDGEGGWFLATHGQLLWVRANGNVRVLGRHDGLVAAGASDAMRDREGNVWVTSVRGISKIVDTSIETWTTVHGLFDDEVSVIYPMGDGVVALGHHNGLTFLRNEHLGANEATILTFPIPTDLTSHRVMGIARTSTDNLWLASGHDGLIGYDISGGEIGRYNAGIEGLHAIAARGDEIFAGGRLGLWRKVGDDPPQKIDLKHPNRPTLYVRKILVDSEDNVWLGLLSGGLCRLGPDLQPTWFITNERGIRNVYTLLETSDGEILAGTAGGVARIEGDRLVACPLSEDESSLARPVYMLAEGKEGEIWAGSDIGVARWHEGAVRWITPADGLSGPETNRAAGYVDPEGRLWVGTDGGLSIIDLERQPERSAGPSASLVGLDDGVQLHPISTERIVLPSGTPALSWSVRAISFVDEERVRFRYRLNGFEEEWRGPVELPDRRVRYMNLEPGTYTLELQAIDRNGRTSDVLVSSPVVIERPLTQRPWFRLVFILALIGLSVLLASLLTAARHRQLLRTEVRERTEELERSRQALAATLDNMAEGLCVVDRDGYVTLTNSAAVHLIGQGHPVLIGAANARDLFGEEILAVDDKPAELSTRIQTPAGERDIELSSAPLHGGAILVFRDVTHRLELERGIANMERMESVGLLAGGIAHDFNNYLTVVQGTLGLVSDQVELPARLLNQVQSAERTLERASGLTRQLLTFSTGGAPVRESVSVAELLSEAAAFALSGSNISASIEVPADLMRATADPSQVTEVLHNLLLNARQAMPEGGEVILRARNLDTESPGLEPGPYVEIEVEDNGPGIADEHLPQVFEPFFTQREGGTGLGLAVARSVIARHGGTLDVRSKVGRGSCFRFVLPAAREAATEPSSASAPVTIEGSRVLIMDDEPAISTLLGRMLDKLGCESVVTRNGDEALEQFTRAQEAGQPFDVSILDLTVVGGMGGREAAAKIREVDPEARMIVASGYSNDALLSEYEEHGFTACLPKPFRLPDLKEALGHSLV